MDLSGRLEAHPLIAALVVCHGAMFLVSVSALSLRHKGGMRASLWLLVAALLLNTWIIAGRWVEGARPPFKTLFETFLFYPWCVTVVTMALLALHRLWILVPFAAGVSLAGLGYALYKPDAEIVNLPPALQSVWFVPHVVTYFVAYAGLFASFALAVSALLWPRWRLSGGGPADASAGFEQYAHKAALFGIVALTLGLVMGAVWGKYAWGDYWSWDPKENWALVTWLAYLIYLHLRLMDGWQGRRVMVLLVAAFGVVVFTYLGIHFLPTSEGSLHVYQ